jgi:hypothetical protein
VLKRVCGADAVWAEISIVCLTLPGNRAAAVYSVDPAQNPYACGPPHRLCLNIAPYEDEIISSHAVPKGTFNGPDPLVIETHLYGAIIQITPRPFRKQKPAAIRLLTSRLAMVNELPYWRHHQESIRCWCDPVRFDLFDHTDYHSSTS